MAFFFLVAVLAASLSSAAGQTRSIVHFKGTTAADLNQVIANAADHSIIQLAPKTYVFDQSIVIARSHINLTGHGRDKTLLLFRMAEQDAGDFIQIIGGHKHRIGRLTQSAAQSTPILKLAPGHRLATGDVVYLSRPNSPAFLKRHNWQGLDAKKTRRRPLREAIASVARGGMLTVELANDLPAEFPKRISTVHKIHAVRQVTVSDLSIQFDGDRPNPYAFANAIPDVASAAAIRLTRTVDTRVERVNIVNTISKGIALDSSLRPVVKSVRVDGSHNKGIRGEGYGIELRETFDSQLSDLTLLNTRHAVLFSSWHMEAGNRVHIRHTNRDVNFHGGLDHSNEAVIDEMVLDYDMRQRNRRPKHAWSAITKGGRNHPNTNFFASNAIAMKSVTSSWRNDILIAGNEGSALNSADGYDVLIGGRGSDVVSGGRQSDIYLLGEGHDTNTNFEPGAHGDAIWVPFSFSELTKHAAQESRGLVIKWRDDFSVSLLGVELDQLHPNNFKRCTHDCKHRILARRYRLEPGVPRF